MYHVHCSVLYLRLSPTLHTLLNSPLCFWYSQPPDLSYHTFHCWFSCFFCLRSLYMEWPSLSSPTETLSGLLQIPSPRVTFTWWECYGLCHRNKPTELAHSWFCSCVCFCLYGPFTWISFHKFSRQLSAFSLCSSGLISAVLVLSTISLYKSLPQPWYNPLWLTGRKAPTNQPSNPTSKHFFFENRPTIFSPLALLSPSVVSPSL